MRDNSKLKAALWACGQLIWIRIRLVFARDTSKRQYFKLMAKVVMRELTICLNR